MTYSISIAIYRESDIGTNFHQAMEIAYRIECIRNQEREATGRDNRPRCFGSFNGTSSFNSLLVSLYRALSIQDSSNGYMGHQGQIQVQQPPSSRGCYEYGELGHVRRYCPRLAGGAAPQISQSVVSALVVSSPTQSDREGGHVAKGRPRGGGQVGGS